MEKNQALYEELVSLREKLRSKAKAKGKTFTCNDSVLEQIATLLPSKLSDFEGISGVGPVFIENYAPYFIEVVKKYSKEDDNIVTLNKKGVAILQDYEKKLVNLNKRNHLLYCPKLYGKFAVDLFESDTDVRNIILSSGRGANVAKPEDKNYKTIISLLRTNNRNLREKGQNNLFIAYPFVKGKFAGEDFTVRAPLALFPIKEEKTAKGIKLSIDKEREILYNTTLILANYKFNNLNKAIPSDDLEDNSKETFLSSLTEFYKQHLIEIQIPEEENELHAFENFTADTFPALKKGEFILDNSAVLGIFPITSSSIQKDFQNIAAEKKINKLLDDLLENQDYEPFNSEYPEDISENELCYINNLDAAQENVISLLNRTDELVIQGPPGTGKSQTITSLIADHINKDKSVLLVSEKKTALDVVYSRLGPLSKYALILDDVNDKESFYTQLNTMVKQEDVSVPDVSELSTSETTIDQNVEYLQNISQNFFEPDDFGIEPYKLYLLCNIKELLEKDNLIKFRTISEILGDNYQKFTYQDCIQANNFYSINENLTQVEEYRKLSKDYPWLKQMKKNLTDFELQDFSIDLDKLAELKSQRENLPVFKKIFSKNEVKVFINQILTKYFEIDDKNAKKLQSKHFYNNYENLVNGSGEYKKFWKLDEVFVELSELSVEYFDSMEKILPLCGENATLETANEELLKFLLAKRLMDFEAKYRNDIPTLEHFEKILAAIDENINKKRSLEREQLEHMLSDRISILSQSKRRSDILKAVESKRKWSVNKFIDKYNFELFNAVKIWLLTPEVVSEIIPLETGFFDLVIFDEASQMFVEKGLPSILRGKKVVIAGDQKQLRPSNLFAGRYQLDEDTIPEDDELSIATDEDSLLDMARFKYNKIMLNFHYRSAFEELIAFSNYAFYDAKLYVSPNTTTPELPPIEVHKMEDALWTNRANEKEAEYIVELIKDFFKNREHEETIGVITFNTNQRDKIDDLLDKECEKDKEFAKAYNQELNRKKDGEDIGLFVKNIETVQGDERDVIIFSMGYAKNEEGKFIQNFGWLNQHGGENRLNVAISRAKQKIHIVVSFEPEELKTDAAKNNGPEMLKKYLQYAFAVSDKDTEKAAMILKSCIKSEEESEDSETDTTEVETEAATMESENLIDSCQMSFESEIEAILSENGYEFDRNLGIGGYTIDFAVKKDNQYILGIETDAKIYDSSKSAREHDYYRNKYLETRGWNMYRLWTILWKKNPEEEAAKLIAHLEEIISEDK